jgi:hypothetical protein
MARGEEPEAGIDLLGRMQTSGLDLPVIFYTGRFAAQRPEAALRAGAFASTNVSEELYELVKKAVRRVDKRAVLVASVEALALENRKLAERWQMLAVFPADFDHRAVAAMWEFDERAALQSINELVQRSMLLFDEVDGRYRVHDLLRDLTRLPLEGEDDAAVERRLEGAAAGHAKDYCGVLARAQDLYLDGAENVFAGLALYDLEQRNIGAGRAWAAEHIDISEDATRLAH